MVVIRKATCEDIRVLSRLLLALLEDKDSEVYKENVVKFGVPESHVRKAFAEDTLLDATVNRRAAFYLAFENDEITGFAQTIQQNADTAVLDRMIVFPEHTRKGIGTRMLNKVIADERKRGIKSIIVNVGRDENHARRFYEKNGFKKVEEEIIEAPWGKKLALVIYKLKVCS